MSRTPIPFAVDDVATLARTLQRGLADAHDKPGHVELMNLIARSAGFRNYQHMRADRLAAEKLDAPAPIEPPADQTRVMKALALFDTDGTLARWPVKVSLQTLALWALWAALPARSVMTDREISDRLKTLHTFGDHALLRRELVDAGLFTRTMDGREYRRVERRPPPDARDVIRRLAQRYALAGVDA
jgi:hypothetical protein